MEERLGEVALGSTWHRLSFARKFCSSFQLKLDEDAGLAEDTQLKVPPFVPIGLPLRTPASSQSYKGISMAEAVYVGGVPDHIKAIAARSAFAQRIQLECKAD